jgi:hypothetical protein
MNDAALLACNMYDVVGGSTEVAWRAAVGLRPPSRRPTHRRHEIEPDSDRSEFMLRSGSADRIHVSGAFAPDRLVIDNAQVGRRAHSRPFAKADVSFNRAVRRLSLMRRRSSHSLRPPPKSVPQGEAAYSSIGSRSPLSACLPRSSKRRPEPATRSFTVRETKISLGPARAETREAIWTAMP